jgi:periplasmic divalent cation tolerance protein
MRRQAFRVRGVASAYKVVLITAPKGKGVEIARRIVEERLAACVNVVSGVTSIYWWEGKVNVDDEDLLIVKTRGDAVGALVRRVKEIHPYTVPEIIALDIVEGNPDYLRWVEEEVKPVGGGSVAAAGSGEDKG